MFKNINKIFIWIVGLIICYVFYNVFILENFSSLSTQINSKRHAIKTAKDTITKLENELAALELKQNLKIEERNKNLEKKS